MTASPTTEAARGGLFSPVERCWVCGGPTLAPFHEARFDFTAYATQDPELHQYTGRRVRLARCVACGFGQPEGMPTLSRYFDRMYDQHWAEEWVAREFDAEYKDFIFQAILKQLARRLSAERRRLLDVGAHAGRFMRQAQQAGWEVEGIELNPRTAAYAGLRTGRPVHHVNAHALATGTRRYDAITLTDVLEHIPDPVPLLSTLVSLLEPGGVLAVKVPCGPGQRVKERVLAALTAHEVSLADNLVHVNHFSPRSLRLALARAGCEQIVIRSGAPELLPSERRAVRRALSNAARLSVYAASRLPGGVFTPLALHLQAYACRPR